MSDPILEPHTPQHDPLANRRWGIAIAGVFMQIALGAVYAWSVFRDPLIRQFHEFNWTVAKVTTTFTIAIFTLGVASFIGGLWLNKSGPRIVALTAGLCYGLGVFLAGFTHSLGWLYATYGILGGMGLGLGYIVPVTVLLKWFPDKRGLITGIAVGGFGAGALVTAPAARAMINHIGVLTTFMWLGVAYFVIVIVAGYFMVNPPADWKPAGWMPTQAQTAQRSRHEFTLGQSLATWQWWALWILLFLNTSAGISIISQESPLFTKISGVDTLVAAGLVGICSLGNGVGRVFWAWVSDFITRRFAFLTMFLLQILLFALFPTTHRPYLLATLTFVILMCYGGGFGTMPAFTADYFGPKNVGPIYGLMLTAWGFASIFGPMLIAHLYEQKNRYDEALYIIAGVMALSAILPLIVHPPDRRVDRDRTQTPGMRPAPMG